MSEISVILSVYNGMPHVGRAVESILGQTLTDFEFIIIDDGSTDGTGSLLRELDDPRIVLLKNEKNLGLSRSLNRGLEKARGAYIARMDADDLSDSTRLEKQMAAIQAEQGLKILFTCFRRIDEKGKVFQDVPIPMSPEAVYLNLFFNNCLVHGSALVETEFIRGMGGYDETYPAAQDYELWSRVKEKTRIVVLPEILYSLRDHPSAVSRDAGGIQGRFFRMKLNENLSALTGGRSDRWDDRFVDRLRAVEKDEITPEEDERARSELRELFGKIEVCAPTFIEQQKLKEAEADYMNRFDSYITVRRD